MTDSPPPGWYEPDDEPEDRDHYAGCSGDPRFCDCDEVARWEERMRDEGL